MTNDHDPVEAWLGTDIELLAPPPGAYERVRRRARRRRAVRTIGTTAGAAVILTAAVALPQVSGGLLHETPTGPNKVGPGTTTPGSPGATTSQKPTSPISSRPGLPLAAAGLGPRPAAGFLPMSVTFVDASLGAVLGQAGSSCGGPCTVLAGTPDYGGTWTAIGAPPAGPPDGSSGVSQVRFLNKANGWAYGPALYATHDGGRSWTGIGYLPGRVIDLATVAGRAFAVVGTGCAGSAARFAEGCTGFSLYSAPAAGDRWRAVAGASGSGQVVPGGLQLSQHYGYLITGGRLYAGPLTGGAWHAATVAPAAPGCLTGQAAGGPGLLAPRRTASGADALFLVCQDPSKNPPLSLYLSGDRGSTWQPRGAVLVPGRAMSLAVSPAGTLVLATTAGIYISPDARAWHRASLAGTGPGEGGGFRFAGMTTASEGVAVPAGSAPHELFITRDGGRTWRATPIG